MSLADDIDAYSAYRNGYETAKHVLDDAELALFEEDMAKAKAAMEVSWHELGFRKVFGGWAAAKPEPRSEERHGANWPTQPSDPHA